MCASNDSLVHTIQVKNAKGLTEYDLEKIFMTVQILVHDELSEVIILTSF